QRVVVGLGKGVGRERFVGLSLLVHLLEDEAGAEAVTRPILDLATWIRSRHARGNGEQRGEPAMIIGIPVYDQVDMFDVTGAFEMFDWAGFEIDLLAAEAGPMRFRSKGFGYEVTRSFAQARKYDAIWVPGGEPEALAAIMDDPKRTYLDFLVEQSSRV